MKNLKVITILILFILLGLGAVIADKTIEEKNRECALKYECKEKNGYYWFDCYYEPKDGSCHCFLGDFSRCNVSIISMQKPTLCEQIGPNYCGYAGNAASYAKLGAGYLWSNKYFLYAGVVVIVILIFLAWFYNRDSLRNNLRRARNYHKKAEKQYLKGNNERAKNYYELANYYRERASR